MLANQILVASIQVLLLLGFNVLFFSWLDDYSISRWVCWGYIHLSYLLLLVAACFKGQGRGGHIFAYPKLTVAGWHAFVAFVVGCVLIVINFQSLTVPLFILAFCVSGALVTYIVLMLTEAHTAATVAQDRAHRQTIQDWTARAGQIRASLTDPRARKRVEAVLDACRAAPLASCPEVEPLEREVESLLERLGEAAKEGRPLDELCARVLETLRLREAQIRIRQ